MSDCKTVKAAIRQRAEDAYRDHLDGCEDCRLYLHNQSLLHPMEEKPISQDSLNVLFQQIESETVHRAGVSAQLKSLHSSTRLWIVATLSAVILLFVLVFTRRVDWHVYPSVRLFTELCGMAGILYLHLWLLIRPLHLPKIPSWRRVGLVCTTVAWVTIPLLFSPAHTDHPASLEGVDDDLVTRALACFGWGTFIGAILLISAWWMMRGQRNHNWTSPPLLTASAMLALSALHLHCPIVHSLHIVLGHTSIILGAWIALIISRGLRK